MNKKNVLRTILTAAIITCAVIFRLAGLTTQSYIIMFSGITVLLLSGISFTVGKNRNQNPPDSGSLGERFFMKILFIALLFVLGILLATGENVFTGLGIMAGVIILLPFQIKAFRSQWAKVQAGLVLWDERDLIIAGKAARATINIQIIYLFLGILAFQVFSSDMSIMANTGVICLSVIIAATVFTYYIIYIILRKREM